MITRNVVRRLERLEGQMLLPREIHVIRVVYADGPDGVPVGGYTVGPGCGSRDKWGICLNDESDY
jgi:hypothetical protein